jgi:hypothetical protein
MVDKSSDNRSATALEALVHGLDRARARASAVKAVVATLSVVLSGALLLVHVSAETVDPHAYFLALSSRADMWKSYSLRDQQQLLDNRQSRSLPPNINYSYPSDPDPRRQDAAKVIVPANDTSIDNQVRLNIDYRAGHSYLFTWDYWMGREWDFANTSMGNCKQFNFGNPAGATYMLTQSTFYKAVPGTIALFTIRGHTSDLDDSTVWPTADKERYVYPERWTRVWRLLVPNADGTFHAWAWFADEQQEPALIYENVRFDYPPAGEALGQFWLEYATSENLWDIPPTRGPLVSYVRNLVILRDLTPAGVTALLEKPLVPESLRAAAPENVRIIR